MKKPKQDHISAIVKAGVSAIPWVGGPLASLIGDYVPTATQRSIELSVEMLKQRIEQLEDRIDIDAIDRDEFAELFKSCYLAIVRTHRPEKLRAAVALLTNILLRRGDPDKLGYTELDHYARCVESLSSGAFEVLAHVESIGRSRSGSNGGLRSVRFTFGDLRRRIEEIHAPLLLGLVAELNAHSLVDLHDPAGGRTENDDNRPIELTTLGTRFVRYLLTT